MGIIKKIVFTFFIFLTVQTSAQTYDTIIFSGKKFVEHFVKGGESLKKIAKLHNVKTSEIKDANELNKRLFYNQLLYIPIYLNKVDEKAVSVNELIVDEVAIINDSSVTNIALLMPYYLVKNDTMFNNYKATLEIPNIVFEKSKSALSFHIGIELALDSLRRAGRNIVLHTFDTNQDTLEVRKIICSNRLNNMDVIIGPLYSKFFQMLCKKYGKDTSKVLIAPLSINTKGISKYPAVYQIAPSNKLQTEILTDYLLANKKDERIVLLHDKKEKGLSAYVKHLFNTAGKEVSVFKVKNTKVDSIRNFFTEQQNVMLLSSNKAFISKMLGSIGSIDSISTVFAFESVKGFDNLDITNLMELDVHILNSSSVDYSKNYDLRFLKLFELEYKTNERKYTKVAYDIIMHFCGNSNVYEFKQNSFGFNQNTLTPIFHYSDYELIPVN